MAKLPNEQLIPIQPEAEKGTYSVWTEEGFDLDVALNSIHGPIYQGYQNIFPESSLQICFLMAELF